MRIEKLSLLAALIVLPLLFACGQKTVDLGELGSVGEQATVTTGTAETPASLDTNFTNIESNFTELYGKVITGLSLSGTTLTITLDDATTVTADISGIQDGTGTDSQTITALSLDSETNILTVTISGGNTATVDLSGLAGGSGSTELDALTDVTGEGTTDYMLYDDGDGTYSFRAAPSGTFDPDSNIAFTGTNTHTGTETFSGTVNLPASTTLPNDSVGANQLADADLGDISVSGGVVTVDNYTHNHSGTYEPADATILKDADIGSTVQGYDANLPTWPSTVDATEVGYLNGVTSSIQGQIDNISVGSTVTTVPTYSDASCTPGQIAYDVSTPSTPVKYECFADGDWNYWDTVTGLVDWSNPTPSTYDLTMAITDTTGTGSTFTVNSDSATVADTPKTWTGLSSATEAVTFAANTTETSSCTGTGVTGSDPNWVVDMSNADVTDMACTVSAGSGGALSYVGSASDVNASSTAISMTHGLTINSGDWILAIVNYNSTGIIVSDNNSGYEFTSVTVNESTSSGRHIFRRIAGASEPANYDFTLASAQRNASVLLVFRPTTGSVATNSFDVTPAAVNVSNDTTITATGVTATVDDAIQIVVGYIDGTATFSSFNGSGFTEAVTVDGNQGVSVYFKGVNSGTTSTETFTIGDTTEGFGEQFILKPAE